jgi:pyruvate/2-oxoglutarate dehydrogenase complex dihydrolipoamide dehydrogenase (E3) component
MEAARVARMRGHEVTLCEEDKRLGGLIEAASKASFKEELRSITAYYEVVLNKLGVTVNLGTRADMETVRQARPDEVVLATGSAPKVPEIPGADLPHVVSALDLLLEKVKIRDSAVVMGGGTVGCEAAMFLAERGCRVTVVEMGPYVAHGIPRLLGKMMKEAMGEAGVQVAAGHRVVEIVEGGVVCEGPGKRTRRVSAAWVVLAVGWDPRDELADELGSVFQEVHAVGDCVEPRRLVEAILEGARAGLVV